ncbi:protein extra-macrochaetae-like [Macrobrachium nipponense]|uniref:protein extra-macrochaetae-like n=1 Tax=Macrobrachium nipponense TaxID=159736 RepID=UPI0030C871EA
MKPDKPPPPAPPPPARDRDILRARNSRPLKKTNRTSPPAMPASLSESEVMAGEGTDPPSTSSGSSSVTPSDDVDISTTSSSSSSSLPLAESSSSSSSSGGEKDKGAEMKLYLDKLRELVPYVPRTGKISRVQLIHSAIDYITDLQESLEARARRKLRDKNDQASRPPLAALSQAHVETNNRMTPLAENSTNRQPTPLEVNTRHPSTVVPMSSASPLEGISPNNANPPLPPSGSHSNPSSSSSPIIPAAPGPPPPSSSPQQPS